MQCIPLCNYVKFICCRKFHVESFFHELWRKHKHIKKNSKEAPTIKGSAGSSVREGEHRDSTNAKASSAQLRWLLFIAMSSNFSAFLNLNLKSWRRNDGARKEKSSHSSSYSLLGDEQWWRNPISIPLFQLRCPREIWRNLSKHRLRRWEECLKSEKRMLLTTFEAFFIAKVKKR